jgi:glycosyltransferase involved in cell wall biosynthesis
MKTSVKVVIVGKVPPPFGGVTVHLSRLAYHLAARQFPFKFLELTNKKHSKEYLLGCKNAFVLIWHLLFESYDVVHCHASNPLLLVLVDIIVAAILRRKVVYTLHGEGNLLLCESGPFLKKWLIRSALKRATRIIALNSNCEERATKFANSRDVVLKITAYLPPAPSELIPGQPFSEELEGFFSGHEICFASQGTFGNCYKGVDLYRFDLLAKALVESRLKNVNMGLVTLVSQTVNLSAREKVYALRRDLGLEKHWLILENFGSAIPVYLRCSAFIRPTMSDGDSMSVRECLDLGIPVIASDAVPRPDGCILFSSGELGSLVASIEHLLEDYPSFKLKAEGAESSSCLESLLTCYNGI